MHATTAPAVQTPARPPWWRQPLQAFEPLPYRACDLCRHGIDIGGVRHCVCADVVLPTRPQPVTVVRAPTGACGVEPRHFDFPGLNG